MKIIKVHKVIHKRYMKENYLWKIFHKAKMFTCKHSSVEPIQQNEHNYYSSKQYGECHNCKALLEITVSTDTNSRSQESRLSSGSYGLDR